MNSNYEVTGGPEISGSGMLKTMLGWLTEPKRCSKRSLWGRRCLWTGILLAVVGCVWIPSQARAQSCDVNVIAILSDAFWGTILDVFANDPNDPNSTNNIYKAQRCGSYLVDPKAGSCQVPDATCSLTATHSPASATFQLTPIYETNIYMDGGTNVTNVTTFYKFWDFSDDLDSITVNVTASGPCHSGGTGHGSLSFTLDFSESTCRGSCQQSQPGSLSADNNCLDFKVNLGQASVLYDAGYLLLQADTPSLNLAKPAGLAYPFPHLNVSMLTNADGIKQVLTPTILANVAVTTTNYAYQLKLFYSNSITGVDGNGFYTVGTNSPFVTYVINNPDTSNADNRLWITEQRSGLSDRVFKYSYSNTNGQANRWDLLQPDGTTISKWFVADTNDATITNYYFLATDTNGTILSQKIATVQYLASVNLALTNSVVLGTNAQTETTTFTYYPTNAATGANLIRRVDYPDGNWIYYTYDQFTRVTNEYSAFNNSTPPGSVTQEPTVASNHCKLTIYDYTPIAGTDDVGTNIFTARTTTVTLPVQSGTNWSAQEVSRTYRSVTTYRTEERQCTVPGASWSDAGNLTNITLLYDFPKVDDTLFAKAYNSGKIHSVSHPDGTATVYEYTKTDTNLTITESVGQPDTYGAGGVFYSWWGQDWRDSDHIAFEAIWNITNGTRTITITDQLGRLQSRTVREISNGVETATLSSASYLYLTNDPLGRNFIITDLAGRQTTNIFECCGLGTVTDPDGIETDYTYDSMKRVSTITDKRGANNIITTDLYDPLGRLAVLTRTGTDSSVITNRQNQYDILGRVAVETNALNGVTTTSNVIASNQRTITTMYPDTGTRVELYYRDGGLQSLTGTAPNPVRYTNFVDSDGGYYRRVRQEIKLATNGADTTEWTKTYQDAAGQPYKTMSAKASNPPSSLSYYNTGGQLTNQVDPDGVSTIYVYNAKGERTHFIVDMNQDGVIDWTGNDRITLTTNDVTTDNGATVTRTQTHLWNINNSGTPILYSTVETSVDGLSNWSIGWNNGVGVTNWSQTVYTGGGNRSMTSYAADGTSSARTFQYGRPLSVTNFDSTNGVISSATYGYDAHGRHSTITDARTGTTTLHFNAMDLVDIVTTPSPGGGQSAEVTTNFFDNMGRLTGAVLPDGTNSTVTNHYNLKGQLAQTSGARTYPVGYGYDAQGRMTTMTNWTNFSGNSGARVTTWNYNAYRGWLDNKQYPDTTGPTYSYTDAGRLKVRQWARGVNTTNTYNSAGELATVIYTDTTPGVTNVYNRLGRMVTNYNGPIVCTFAYNDAGNVLSESYSGGVLDSISVTNGYDNLLRRTNVLARYSTTPLSSNSFTYDVAGRISVVSDGTNSGTYSYLANSPLVSQILLKQGSNSRMTTAKAYDNLNRLTSLGSTTNSVSVSSAGYAYNAANQRTAMTNGNGTRWEYGYDKLGQVTSGTDRWTGDSSIVAGRQFDFTFDDIGNRMSSDFGGDASQNNLRTVMYVANNLNQYTSRTNPGYFEVTGSATSPGVVTVNGNTAYRKSDYFWSELSVSNGTNSVWEGVTTTAILPPGPNGTITGNAFVPKNAETFAYDGDGNLTNDGRWTYTWDAENRLLNQTSLTNAPTGSKYKLDFTYDYMGRRIQKLVSTNNGSTYGASYTNKFTYDGWNLAAILDGYNHSFYSFNWGLDLSGSQQGAGGVGGLVSMTVCTGTNAGTYFPCYDGNGNVMALVNAADGTGAAMYEYGPFGELIHSAGPMASSNPFLFATKFYDLEAGLCYYGYRFYNPGTGRWLSRDPLTESGGIALYVMVANDPITSLDTDGRSVYPVNSIAAILASIAQQLTVYFYSDPWLIKHNHSVVCPCGSKEYLLYEMKQVTTRKVSATATIGNDTYNVVPSKYTPPITLFTLIDQIHGCCKYNGLFGRSTTGWKYGSLPSRTDPVNTSGFQVPWPDVKVSVNVNDITTYNSSETSCVEEVKPLLSGDSTMVCKGNWPFRHCN